MLSSHSTKIVNFCVESFVSNVRCVSVTPDGYGPLNLITSEPRKRSKGFRVEHYIRPPITIEMDLLVPVSLSCILLCPDLLPQAEMRVELSGSVRRDHTPQQFFMESIVGGEGVVLVARNQHPTNQLQSLQELVHNNLSGLCHSCKLVELPFKKIKMVQSLRHLRLKIIWWSGPKPVTLKWLEIWGTLSKNSSGSEISMFHTRINESSSSLQTLSRSQSPGIFIERKVSETKNSYTTSKSSEGSAICVKDSHVKAKDSHVKVKDSHVKVKDSHVKVKDSHGTAMDIIPTRYLDELTCEVMVLPMLLPSGHYVDRSTLDKLAQNDATSGRPPTDPFTGVAFNEFCKPEFCSELKVQLDNYDIPLQYRSKNPGRTVGSHGEIQNHILKKIRKSNNDTSPPDFSSKRLKLDDSKSQFTLLSKDDPSCRATSQDAAGQGAAGQGAAGQGVAGQGAAETSNFDLEVDDSLDRALHQLFPKH